MTKGALDGIKVIDATIAFAGPYCTKNLADLGAEVIHIESGGRQNGRKVTIDGKTVEVYPTWDVWNRNKKSMALNLKTPEGQAILKDLARTSDIFMTNFAPGVMERLNASYEQISSVNPKLIYCKITAFGEKGPYSDRKGYDRIYQAMSGQLMMNTVNGVPYDFPNAINDYYAGLHAGMAILAALHYRERTGRGQKIDISMFDCAMTTLQGDVENYTYLGQRRQFERLPGNTNYLCKDGGYILISIFGKMWNDFFRAIGRDDLIDSSWIDNYQTDKKKIEFLDKLVSDWASGHTVEEAYKECLRVNIPVGPVQDVDKAIEDEQLKLRGMVVPVHMTGVGKVGVTMGSPFQMSETPGRVTIGSPLYGEHTEEVLRSLNYSDEKIRDLKVKGILK